MRYDGRLRALTAVLASGGQGLAYALCLPGGDVRPVCKALNEAFGGRGGGKPRMIQGSTTAAAESIARAMERDFR